MSHRIIVVPGLGRDDTKLRIITKFWKKFNLEAEVWNPGWYNTQSFKMKLIGLLEIIDKYYKNGDKLSLVGSSAGGSMVLNAFLLRRQEIYRVISVCGRLRRGEFRGIRSFSARVKSSKAFHDSVIAFERGESSLTQADKNRIMTIRAIFDELVPGGTAVIEGANNMMIPCLEHVLSIGAALTCYRPLINFLTE